MLGVYISYPFCAQKCTYCNFASGVLPRTDEARYPEALLCEIAAAQFPSLPDTVYLGGGTPSAMEPDALATILRAVPGAPWREATLETAPGTVDPRRALAWQRAGINRVSLGTQSFVPRELARTGRRHTPESAAADIATLRSAGLTNINLDLIAGLPGQTADSWATSLDWIERLAPPHVSVYMLEIDEDSRLGREMLLGGVRYGAADAPDEGLTADLYEIAVERLHAMGIERYEISNFSRPGFKSLHNLKYWHLEPYLGFGADAHSFDGVRRWQNVEAVSDYLRLSPQVRIESTDANADEERFFVGLRLSEGVQLGVSDWARHGATIERLAAHGLLEQEGSTLRLTARGVMVSNEVLGEFLAA